MLVDGTRRQPDLAHTEAARRGIHPHVLLGFVIAVEYGSTAAHATHPVGSREAEIWTAEKLTVTHTAREHQRLRLGPDRQKYNLTA